MRKSHFNDEFLVYLGPIISRLFTCSNEERINKIKKQRVLALVISLFSIHIEIANMHCQRIACTISFYTGLGRLK